MAFKAIAQVVHAIDASGTPVEIPKLLVEDQAEWEHAELIRANAAARRKRRSQ